MTSVSVKNKDLFHLIKTINDLIDKPYKGLTHDIIS